MAMLNSDLVDRGEDSDDNDNYDRHHGDDGSDGVSGGLLPVGLTTTEEPRYLVVVVGSC